jgi:hypothetical protein
MVPLHLTKTEKFRTQASAGKVMLMLFWDHQGQIVEQYMSEGITVTTATYCDFLRNNLKPGITLKLCGLLSTGVLLQHDNAAPYLAFNSCDH